MDEWKPDEKVLRNIGRAWGEQQILDRSVVDDISGPDTIEELVKVLRDDGFVPGAADYVEETFPSDQNIPDEKYTRRKLIDAMRERTPYAIFRYSKLETHFKLARSQ